MRLRKNILNKKSHCLVFGFFLFCLGLYLFSYSYITNKRQEIFDGMNFKLYEQDEKGTTSEEIDVPEITVADETEPQEEIAASPIQQTAEQIPTPVSNTVPNSDIVTPIPELGGNTVTPQPMPSNTTGQTPVQQSDMIMPKSSFILANS